jgi:hypothetical protein
VPEHDRFETADLFEAKDMRRVRRCLVALSGVAEDLSAELAVEEAEAERTAAAELAAEEAEAEELAAAELAAEEAEAERIVAAELAAEEAEAERTAAEELAAEEAEAERVVAADLAAEEVEAEWVAAVELAADEGSRLRFRRKAEEEAKAARIVDWIPPPRLDAGDPQDGKIHRVTFLAQDSIQR